MMKTGSNIIPFFTPEQIEHRKAAEREMVVGEIKYQMCLCALRGLLERGTLSQEEYHRAESRVAQRYRAETVHLQK